MTPKAQYVLIDYENVQPKDLGLLDGHPFKVFVFVGSNQSKISTEFAAALQARGDNGQYVRMQGNGRNALDFLIAFQLGELITSDGAARFHIISKDAGFDPLIGFLRSKGIAVQRCAGLASVIPVPDDQIASVVQLIAGQDTRPRSVKSLTKTIANWLKTLEMPQVQALIEALEQRGVISVQNGRVSYSLPE